MHNFDNLEWAWSGLLQVEIATITFKQFEKTQCDKTNDQKNVSEVKASLGVPFSLGNSGGTKDQIGAHS